MKMTLLYYVKKVNDLYLLQLIVVGFASPSQRHLPV